jgi:magnesium-transporting ATPase (P-type)
MASSGQPDWHSLEQDQVLELLDADSAGLDEAESRRRLETYGPNRLPEPPRSHPFARFLLQFHNILIYVLLGAVGITALLHQTVGMLVILAVVLVNALIGFVQEGKAESAMEVIRQRLAPRMAVASDCSWAG